MKTTVIGAYPKIGDELPAQELRRALHRHDRGEIGDAELDKVYDDVTRSTIGEIEAAGVDVVNDGQIRWDDLLSPFARTWSGIEPGPLERFYDNNTYFRQPVITGPIVTDGKSLVRDFTFARGVAKAQLKAAVPGPLTFATLVSRDEHYGSLEDRLLAVVDARNTRLETAAEVAGYAERALKLVPLDHLRLAPTTSLEYLPRDIARAKLAALVEGARLVTGEKVPA